MNWYLDAWRNYAVFRGRARRSAYWYFVLFNLIAAFIASFLDTALGLHTMTGTGILAALYGLAAIIPGLAVGARRLHDTGRSGWLLLLCLIPIVGWIFLLIWMTQDSYPGANEYGPNPKAMAAPVA